MKLLEEGDDQELTGEDVKYPSVVAPENCKAHDRPDVRFAVKELCPSCGAFGPTAGSAVGREVNVSLLPI